MNPTTTQQQQQTAAVATSIAKNGGGSGTVDNSNTEAKCLFITHVDAFGPYLKIFGQLNPDACVVLRTKLQQMVTTCFAIDSTWQLARQQALVRPGVLCLHKRIRGAAPADYEMKRTRISNCVVENAQLQVEVEFIDYGYSAIVPSFELLFPQHHDLLQNIPVLCTNYIMLGICKDWKQSELDEILRMIKRQTLDISIKMKFNEFKFIAMKWKEFNFAEFLILQKKIGAPIANDLLRDNFIKYLKQRQQPLQQQQKMYAGSAFVGNNINNNNHINTNNSNNSSFSVNKNNFYGGANNKGNNNNANKAMGIQNGMYATPNADGANRIVEQMAERRSLAARLQQHQQQPLAQHMARPVQPRMPHTIGNLRSMVQGIHLQNNRIPYTGTNIAPTVVMVGTPVAYGAVPNILPMNTYNARYQRPQAPQQHQQQQQSLNTSFGSSTSESSDHSVRRTTTATFKSKNLTVGKVYEVCVSYVENGPCLFSVQLAAAQGDLTDMMNRIERVPLKQIREKPVLGTACIARYAEDGQLYRALITGVQATACKVAYIDYGNAGLVNFRDLYEIPDDFLEAKAFATRFTLSGHKELEPIDESFKKAFKDLVSYKMCKLKVMPLEGPPLVQYCELYMQDKNILAVLKEIQKCRLVYAKAEHLQNNDIVEIRYIESPKHFYVQKVINITDFEKLMDDMYFYYNKNQVVPQHFALGSPCIVKYENEWYRAEVMRVEATVIIVRHVDFGYEQKVTKNLISTIAEQHLKLPRQAVQCCLKGFENNELNKDNSTTQFEMLAEESNRKRRSFTVKVFRIQPDGVNLVNLCTKDLNVMKKLYKLSMPFEQYLTMEKEEFNMHPSHNGHHKNGAGAAGGSLSNGHKTPSVASSNELSSVHSSKKSGNILNSTTLQSDEARDKQKYKQPYVQKTQQQQPLQQQQQQQQQQQPSLPAQQRHNKNYNNALQSSFSTTEWDKNSSASSMDNRDSRSSSSEHKQFGKRNQQQQPQQQQQHRPNKNMHQNMHNTSIASNSSDKRSVGSAASSGYSKGRANNNNNAPTTRYSGNNNARQEHDNRRQQNRQTNQQQGATTPPHNQRGQRPQNAPQGYSQQRGNRSNDKNNTSLCSDDNASAVSGASEQSRPEEYMPLERAFPIQAIETPAREEVIICWWISPHQFYTHIKTRIAEFENLMREMQQFYKKKSLQHLQLRVGSHVIVRYRKDNIIYRARILACNQMLRKYKVHFVDFGNQFTVTSEDIWQVEKRFADFPCMAYLCSFNGIISNFDHLHIIDNMDKYLPGGAALVCEYIEHERDMYYVNVNVNKVSLRETLKADGLITEVSPDLHLDLLAGQQIRAKISSIKDMLNFKIQIEGCDENIKLLCSYDDVRYVKSNHDIAQKFKQFYEGKSCVVNIKDVTDNKIVLLRPLLPLLKEDIPTYISTYPIILENFKVRVVYVASAHRLYAQLLSTEAQMAQLLDDMFAYYDTKGVVLNNFDGEKICAANGCDGNWYRARIVRNSKSSDADGAADIEVCYIDYGNTEKVSKTKLKELIEKFYVGISAYGLEINLPMRTQAADHKHKSKKTNDDLELSIVEELKKLTLDQVLTVKALEMHRNHLMAELIREDSKNVVDVLKDKNLIKGRDIDYMRKLLDKEKPNMLEYIEMVDLTLEDEDDAEKKQTNKHKTATSPKKKKPIKTEEQACAAPKLVTILNEKVEEIKKVVEEKSVKVPEKIIEAQTLPATAAVATTQQLNVEPITALPTSTPTASPKPPSTPEPPTIDPYASMEHAELSHCDNPAQFFLHPKEKIVELHKLQENLQIVASSLPPLMRVINGAHCISHYSVDKQWYRAKILDAELMVVKFIDYGNTDWVTDTSDVKEMSVFPDIEPMCIPCALPIKPNGTADWVDAANAIFNDSYTKMLYYEYITRGDYEKRSFINLYIDGVNIADKLIADGFAKPLISISSGENCYISHVNAITDFYIQYEKDSKALELIEIHLADNEKLKKMEKFELNKIVAALFPDDDMWYRAKLLGPKEERGYQVLFIDYGNTSISPECREISEEIATLPPLSIKCGLELSADCLAWSEAAEQKFAEIAAMGETTFTVELREPAADSALVHLFIDGHNINDDLEILCEHRPSEQDELNLSICNTTLPASVYEIGTLYDAVISHVNSPSDFYVHFNKDVARLEDMTSSLNSLGMDAVTAPAEGLLCAAVYPDDDALYRARVLEIISVKEKKYRVIFIDFGNEAISSDLRVLPQDLHDLKEFSKKVQLENTADYGTNATVALEHFNGLIEECEALVKVEFVDDSAEPAIIKLYAANTEESIGEQLSALMEQHKAAVAAATSSLMTSSIVEKSNTCLISHAYSPSHFYIQPKANPVKLELVSKALQNVNNNDWLDFDRAELGCACCVFVEEDDCYYRGRVERILAAEAGYEVFLLDYGNTVTSKQIHALPKELCAIPALAQKCQLNEIPSNVEASVLEEKFAALLEAHFGEIYEIETDEFDAEQRVHIVKLQVNYKDLAEELAKAVASDAAPEDTISPVPVLLDCTVIHVNSPASFYIQLNTDIAALEQLTDTLLDAETTFEPFTDLQVGAVCAAQFPDDGAYYRAKIVQMLDEGKCEVHYLDFGNNSVTDQFRELPENLLKLEASSKHCALDTNFNATPEVCAQFQGLIDGRFTETFQVEFLKMTTNPMICKLFYQDKEVASELLQLLKDNVVVGALTNGVAAATGYDVNNGAVQ